MNTSNITGMLLSICFALANTDGLGARQSPCKSILGAWKQVRSVNDEKIILTDAGTLDFYSQGKYFIKLNSYGNEISIIFSTGSDTYAFRYARCEESGNSAILTNPTNPSRLRKNVIQFRQGRSKICLDAYLGPRGTQSNPDCFIRLSSEESQNLGNLFDEEFGSLR